MEKPRVVVAGTLPAAGLALLRERFVVDQADDGADTGSLLSRVQAPPRSSCTRRRRSTARCSTPRAKSLAVVANFGVGDRQHRSRRRSRPRGAGHEHAGRAQRRHRGARRHVDAGGGPTRRRRRRDRPRRRVGPMTISSVAGSSARRSGSSASGGSASGWRELLRGFDARVLYSNRSDAARRGAERRELPELLGDVRLRQPAPAALRPTRATSSTRIRSGS